ncbi:MAG: hypothetical protein JRG96_09760 [Deltaproteobacteria bacterium]|nr:hypothetical protein [Deltaproteobacteria bacterium]
MSEAREDEDREPRGEREDEVARGGDARPGGLRHSVWPWIAVAVFCVSLLTPFWEIVVSGDPREVVPLFPRYEGELETRLENFGKTASKNDQLFVAWLVARNARTLLSDPLALYDAEECFPTPNVLAYGEHMITLGIMGIPAHLASGDPLLTFNFVLVMTTFLSALAMYLLVAEWSGVPAAGVVAGLLYAFAPVKLDNVTHPYVNDTMWTVLALMTARRFFAGGRWRDALLTGLFCALQIGGSFYPFLAALLLAVPVLVWLLVDYGVRKLRPAPTLAMLAIILTAGWLVFSPYLDLHANSEVASRTRQAFAEGSVFLPGGRRFPGWLGLSLVAAAFAFGRKRALGGIPGDPRWALLLACPLILVMAMGPHLPGPIDFYSALGALLPGFDSVRIPRDQASGIHLALSLLAGLGAAALLRAAPSRYALAAGLALVLITYAVTLRPTALGLEPPVVYRAHVARPEAETLDFFRSLEARGNRGPVLELPIGYGSPGPRAMQILTSAYHHRPTSSCYNSFIPVEFETTWKLGKKVPDPEAVAALREMGFTTVVAHHSHKTQLVVFDKAKLDRAAAEAEGPLRALYSIPSMSAYEILPRVEDPSDR